MAQKVTVKKKEETVEAQAPVAETTEKKPVYKKWWFWVLIAVVLIILVSAISGGSDSSSDSSAGSAVTAASGETTAKAGDKTSFTVGETYSDKNCTITFVSVNNDFRDIQEYSEIPAGKKVVQATFDFENTGSSDFLASDWDFKCFADDESCDNYIWVDNASFSDTLSPGRKATARSVYFEVPENANSIVLEYEPNFWSNKKIEFVVQ